MNTLTVPIAHTTDCGPVQQRRGPHGASAMGCERRVLVISYLFPPGIEMGAQACAQISRYLPLYGWTPIVLTVQERYLRDIDPRANRAFPGPVIRTGVLTHPFDVYRHLKARLGFAMNGTTGNGASSPRSTGGFRSWVLSLLAVPDAYTGWIPLAIIYGLVAIRRHRVDHLFSSGPPWTGHLVGLTLAWLSGLPWTAHFRDPWTGPQSEMRRLKPVSAFSARIEAALERLVVARAAIVVCVTEQHVGLLRQAHADLPPGKFVSIPNGFDGGEWDGIDTQSDAPSRVEPAQFVITYAGTLYNRRSPLPLFRALRRLIDAGEVAPERIRVDLFGRCDSAGNRHVTELVEECDLAGQVCITGSLSRAQTLRRMARSNLLLLLAEGLTLQVPGKTYEYLRAGRPILALAPDGAVAQLLRKTGGAWIADPADEAQVAAAIRDAYLAWESGRALPAPDRNRVSSFDRRVLAGRFAELFDRTVGVSA